MIKLWREEGGYHILIALTTSSHVVTVAERLYTIGFTFLPQHSVIVFTTLSSPQFCGRVALQNWGGAGWVSCHLPPHKTTTLATSYAQSCSS